MDDLNVSWTYLQVESAAHASGSSRDERMRTRTSSGRSVNTTGGRADSVGMEVSYECVSISVFLNQSQVPFRSTIGKWSVSMKFNSDIVFLRQDYSKIRELRLAVQSMRICNSSDSLFMTW